MLIGCIYLKFLDGLLLLASNGHQLPVLLVRLLQPPAHKRIEDNAHINQPEVFEVV